MAYVMMGRVQDLENLFIVGNFDAKKIRCNKRALEEAMRIEKISRSWKSRDACSLSIVSMNIRSLSKHYQDLKVDYKVMQKDIICLQETWITPQQEQNYKLDGFESFYTSVGKGKGLVTFSKLNVEDNISIVDINATFQLMSTKVKGVTIISVYISSNCSNFETIVNFLSQYKADKCLVIGDFNFNPKSSNKLTNYLKASNFSQLVQSATHKDGNIIDHVYVSEALSALTFVNVHYVYYSDHQGLFINIIEQ